MVGSQISSHLERGMWESESGTGAVWDVVFVVDGASKFNLCGH